MRRPPAIASLLRPFRSQPPPPSLRIGYRLAQACPTGLENLNRLLLLCGEPPRSEELWRRVLERSLWHLVVLDPAERPVGFLRATSDLALNANLWDLLSDPADPGRSEVLAVLVHTALTRLRRELSGCSISLSAPPEAISALTQAGFVLDPGGIRAMGRRLQP
ncbi:MAG: N-acetyltransferase [Cyanobacteriota bacterium]